MMIGLREMTLDDAADVSRIDRQSFVTPWGTRELKKALIANQVLGIVAHDTSGIVGFQLLELHPTSIRVLRIAAAKKRRRQGIGRRLLHEAKGYLCGERRQLELILPKQCPDIQLFFKVCGFRATHALQDGYRMIYRPGLKRVQHNIKFVRRQ